MSTGYHTGTKTCPNCVRKLRALSFSQMQLFLVRMRGGECYRTRFGYRCLVHCRWMNHRDEHCRGHRLG
jgi:hypothetical protein